jgi:hypothetical protein
VEVVVMANLNFTKQQYKKILDNSIIKGDEKPIKVILTCAIVPIIIELMLLIFIFI